MKAGSRRGNARWIWLSFHWMRIFSMVSLMECKIPTSLRFVATPLFSQNPKCRLLTYRVYEKQLGAGTAVPSLTLFARTLSGNENTGKTHFTFADYNSDVLRLVTLPNLLLTWQNSRSQ